MPAKPKPLKQQLAEANAMSAAREAASQTPEEVRQAFLGRRCEIGSVSLVEFSLGILWLFEELHHPFNEPPRLARDSGGNPVPVLDADGEPKLDEDGEPIHQTAPISMRDLARAILIWTDPEAAHEALQDSVAELDAKAMQLVLGIPPGDLQAISVEIGRRFGEGMATITGGKKKAETD